MDYLAWLQTKCASIDLFGLEPKHGSAAKLHSIYVPLTTAAGAEDPDEAVRARGTKPKRSRDVDPSGLEDERLTLLLDRLAKESLYVPGAPGSGKSTFCRWVTWLVCEGRLPNALVVESPEGHGESRPDTFANRLPVRPSSRVLSLAPDLARVDLEASLATWIDANMEGLSCDLFRRHLEQGSALLVLDGVDEVPVTAGEGKARWSPRALLVSGLANSCRAWTMAGNRVLVTSRPYGLTMGDAALLGVASAPVHDIDRPLRELLVRRWFQQLRAGGEGETFVEGLIGHLNENAWLGPLSVNPLLLTGMCVLSRVLAGDGGQFRAFVNDPGNRRLTQRTIVGRRACLANKRVQRPRDRLEQANCRGYVRYVDDMLFFGEDNRFGNIVGLRKAVLRRAVIGPAPGRRQGPHCIATCQEV